MHSALEVCVVADGAPVEGEKCSVTIAHALKVANLKFKPLLSAIAPAATVSFARKLATASVAADSRIGMHLCFI